MGHEDWELHRIGLGASSCTERYGTTRTRAGGALGHREHNSHTRVRAHIIGTCAFVRACARGGVEGARRVCDLRGDVGVCLRGSFVCTKRERERAQSADREFGRV